MSPSFMTIIILQETVVGYPHERKSSCETYYQLSQSPGKLVSISRIIISIDFILFEKRLSV